MTDELYRNKNSPIWDFFSIVKLEDANAKCKNCTKMITRGTNPKQYSTTPLINHLHNKHPNDYAIFIEKKEKKNE